MSHYLASLMGDALILKLLPTISVNLEGGELSGRALVR